MRPIPELQLEATVAIDVLDEGDGRPDWLTQDEIEEAIHEAVAANIEQCYYQNQCTVEFDPEDYGVPCYDEVTLDADRATTRDDNGNEWGELWAVGVPCDTAPLIYIPGAVPVKIAGLNLDDREGKTVPGVPQAVRFRASDLRVLDVTVLQAPAYEVEVEWTVCGIKLSD